MSRTKRRNQNQNKKTATLPQQQQQNAGSNAPRTIQVPAEIAQRLAYAETVVAQINNGGQITPVTAAQFGHFVKDHYSKLYHPWALDYQEYQRNHVMADVVAKLKSGLDELSCAYIDHHIKIMTMASLGGDILFKNDMLRTKEDFRLIERTQEAVAKGQPPFLKQVNLEWSSSYVGLYGMYDLPAQVVQRVNGKAVIDGGGFIGDTLVLFRDLFPQSIKYSFEPAQHSYEYMCNFLKDDIAKGTLKAFHKALGSKSGQLRLSLPCAGGINAASSTRYDYHQEGLYEDVEMISIDEVVAEHQLEVGLIKLDVEGAEPDIIQGALNTIKEQKPLLVIAFYHQPDEFYELKPFLESLNLGYKFMVRRSAISMPISDAVLIAYQDA